MNDNTKLANKESFAQIISEVKELIRSTSTGVLNNVQWEFNNRYLFGNEAERPEIAAGKLFDKKGPILKGAIWTSLDTGKLYMNSGTGWKHIGGLGALTKKDIIKIFNPRKDYPLEDPYAVTNTTGAVFIPYNFKKLEEYAVDKTQGSITCRLVRSRNWNDLAQDISKSFSSVPNTYVFTCTVDDAAYLAYTSGSATIESLTLRDLGSALEPKVLENVTGTLYFNFPIEKGKTYYYTKTACSFYMAYGTGVNDNNFVGTQAHVSGDSGSGTFSFRAEHDGTTIKLFTGTGTIEKFEFRCEDLPDYDLSYPYVVASEDEPLPEDPRVGDMIYNPYQDGGSPLWWNGTEWKGVASSEGTVTDIMVGQEIQSKESGTVTLKTATKSQIENLF